MSVFINTIFHIHIYFDTYCIYDVLDYSSTSLYLYIDRLMPRSLSAYIYIIYILYIYVLCTLYIVALLVYLFALKILNHSLSLNAVCLDYI